MQLDTKSIKQIASKHSGGSPRTRTTTSTTTAYRMDDHEHRLAPFTPSCTQAHKTALEFLTTGNRSSSNATLMDLGCGDGRFLSTAGGFGNFKKCIGLEYNPVFVERAREKVASFSNPSIQVLERDVVEFLTSQQEVDLNMRQEVTAVFMYLLPKGLSQIKPGLEAWKAECPNLKLASYMFAIPEMEYTRVDRSSKGGCPVYLYE